MLSKSVAFSQQTLLQTISILEHLKKHHWLPLWSHFCLFEESSTSLTLFCYICRRSGSALVPRPLSWPYLPNVSCFLQGAVPAFVTRGPIPHSPTHLCACLPAKWLQSCGTLWDPMTIAFQAPLSMGFSRQEYWSGLSCPPPRDLPNTGIKPASPTSPALAGGFFTTGATWEAPMSLASHLLFPADIVVRAGH